MDEPLVSSRRNHVSPGRTLRRNLFEAESRKGGLLPEENPSKIPEAWTRVPEHVSRSHLNHERKVEESAFATTLLDSTISTDPPPKGLQGHRQHGVQPYPPPTEELSQPKGNLDLTSQGPRDFDLASSLGVRRKSDLDTLRKQLQSAPAGGNFSATISPLLDGNTGQLASPHRGRTSLLYGQTNDLDATATDRPHPIGFPPAPSYEGHGRIGGRGVSPYGQARASPVNGRRPTLHADDEEAEVANRTGLDLWTSPKERAERSASRGGQRERRASGLASSPAAGGPAYPWAAASQQLDADLREAADRDAQHQRPGTTAVAAGSSSSFEELSPPRSPLAASRAGLHSSGGNRSVSRSGRRIQIGNGGFLTTREQHENEDRRPDLAATLESSLASTAGSGIKHLSVANGGFMTLPGPDTANHYPYGTKLIDGGKKGSAAGGGPTPFAPYSTNHLYQGEMGKLEEPAILPEFTLKPSAGPSDTYVREALQATAASPNARPPTRSELVHKRVSVERNASAQALQETYDQALAVTTSIGVLPSPDVHSTLLKRPSQRGTGADGRAPLPAAEVVLSATLKGAGGGEHSSDGENVAPAAVSQKARLSLRGKMPPELAGEGSSQQSDTDGEQHQYRTSLRPHTVAGSPTRGRTMGLSGALSSTSGPYSPLTTHVSRCFAPGNPAIAPDRHANEDPAFVMPPSNMTLNGELVTESAEAFRQDSLHARTSNLSTLLAKKAAAEALPLSPNATNQYEEAAKRGMDVTQFGREEKRLPKFTSQLKKNGHETFDIYPEDYLDEMGKRPVFSPGELSPMYSSFAYDRVFKEENIKATRLMHEKMGNRLGLSRTMGAGLGMTGLNDQNNDANSAVSAFHAAAAAAIAKGHALGGSSAVGAAPGTLEGSSVVGPGGGAAGVYDSVHAFRPSTSLGNGQNGLRTRKRVQALAATAKQRLSLTGLGDWHQEPVAIFNSPAKVHHGHGTSIIGAGLGGGGDGDKNQEFSSAHSFPTGAPSSRGAGYMMTERSAPPSPMLQVVLPEPSGRPFTSGDSQGSGATPRKHLPPEGATMARIAMPKTPNTAYSSLLGGAGSKTSNGTPLSSRGALSGVNPSGMSPSRVSTGAGTFHGSAAAGARAGNNSRQLHSAGFGSHDGSFSPLATASSQANYQNNFASSSRPMTSGFASPLGAAKAAATTATGGAALFLSAPSVSPHISSLGAAKGASSPNVTDGQLLSSSLRAFMAKRQHQQTQQHQQYLNYQN